MMKAVKATIVALLLCWAFAAVAEIAVPRLSGRVVDQTATLSGSDVASLEQTLQNFEARKGSQVAVLIVPTLDGEAIEQFSIRVAEAWKIGRKKVDDGAILVVAKNDRKLRIEVGYGLEGALNDATTKRIIDEIITPKFRGGDFVGGISAGVDRILRVIDGEALPVPEAQGQSSDLVDQLGSLSPFLIFGTFVLSGVMRAILGRLLGALATGGIVAALLWFIVSSLFLAGLAGVIAFLFTMFSDSIAGGGRSGGFSGGGGSFSSGSSSSGGGFSGGGGSFGGGGASGSW
jgi:uncharacterized protein